MRKTAMNLTVMLVLAGSLTPVVACQRSESSPGARDASDAPLTRAEAEDIAEEAYIYAYPMMESYRTMYVQAIDRTAPGYRAPFNEITHMTELVGPEFKDIVRPNNDTLYSLGWLDLRAQPMVITVPKIENRYFSVQLVDMFTHNFAYMGTRATNGEAGSYVIAGPEWQGTKPGDTQAVFKSESEFVYCIVRIEVRGPDDLGAVNALQNEFHLTPLHVFLGRSRAPAASGITFPSYDAGKAKSAAFIDLLGFMLDRVRPYGEDELMKRFRRIGIRAGAASASLDLDPATRTAVEAGVGRALVAINRAAGDPSSLPGVTARTEDGWQGLVGIFGDRATMGSNYLTRAAAAMIGLYGNDAEEAYYPIASTDGSETPLDGSKHDYTIRFEREQMPQVDAFWSMTMYSLPDQLMVANSIDRYSIGDRSALRYGEDGSLTLYIQDQSPGKGLEGNWLPSPGGPFSLQFRMYLPKAEALDPLYLPPAVTPVR
ncbi:MAG: DUF1254 domain-containing protein [Deltaproteobacteria bacterium]|jgi:hypothetical protein|nr:DUF1254 domain-containing protein [Deltaproteobacteria bacterium]